MQIIPLEHKCVLMSHSTWSVHLVNMWHRCSSRHCLITGTDVIQ